jgi:Holliday junction resolvase-like predicted endonuclease
VKGKSGSGFGDPLEMVHAEKLRRMRQAAGSWLARHPELTGLDLRFEVVAVRAGTPRGLRFGLPEGTIPERVALVRTATARAHRPTRFSERAAAGETSG